MIYQFLTKLGDNKDPDDSNNEAIMDKHGDIIAIKTEAQAKAQWDWLVANGHNTQAEMNLAEIITGVYRFPYNNWEYSNFFATIVDDTFTEDELTDFIAKDLGTTILGRKHKIDLETMTYFSNTSQARVTLSQASKDRIKNKSIRILPRFDKPILKSEILIKA